jgi:transcriptional regulator with XRE-family HTH domain
MSAIPKRLKEARKAAKLSQEKLGFLLGIEEVSASSRMNQYEKGKHVPHVTLIERLAGILDLPRGYFYTEDDDIARLLVRYHRFKTSDRKKVLAFIDRIGD